MSTKPSNWLRRDVLGAAALAGSAIAADAAPAKPRLNSASALALAPDGKLIVADWKAGKLHAIGLPPGGSRTTSSSFNLKGIDAKIAAALKMPLTRLRFTALAFDHTHNRAIVACEAGPAGAALALAGPEGSVTLVDPAKAPITSFELEDAPEDGLLWERIPARSFLITCLECRAGEVLASGLANADFSSTFRRIPYPFAKQSARTTVEMYHTIHNQIETRAPVRAFATIEADGQPYVLAAYTCTPLVLIPLQELQTGKARGKTIAELGYGNTPVSVVPFQIEYQGKISKWVVVANSSKSADLISQDAIAAAAGKPGLTEPVRVPFATRAGVQAIEAPLSNLVALVDQDPQFLLGMRRDLQTGALDLVSFRKGAFFRLSDHVNEYDFPTYDYPAGDAFQQQYVRPFHKMMRTDEGYPKLVK